MEPGELKEPEELKKPQGARRTSRNHMELEDLKEPLCHGNREALGTTGNQRSSTTRNCREPKGTLGTTGIQRNSRNHKELREPKGLKEPHKKS